MAEADSKHGSTLSETTLDPESLELAESSRFVPILTIAAHPDTDRVGESHVVREPLSKKMLRISRGEPTFGEDAPEPLREPHLSREPVTLFVDRAGLRVDARATSMRVIVNGEEVRAATWVSMEELARGVVLELAGSVVLVLHLTPRPTPLSSWHDMLGGSAPMSELFADVRRASSHSLPVLVRGPSGSGKELVARAIHQESARRAGPFVSVNMAAIPAATAAAELFGHHKGAFTGAATSQRGWFGQADGGTLFLDEIGEAPESIQPMLLRALESGEVQPVGAQGVQKLDVRVVAATDADLEAACQSGRFRFPLLQRLSAQTVRVPPLAARRSDIGPLIVHFLQRELGPRLEQMGTATKPWLSAPIVARALRYAWPGNVRELANFTRELVLVSGDRPRARVGATFDALMPPQMEAATELDVADTRGTEPSEPEALDDDAVVAALRAHQFRVAATARALGISKNTLYQAMERCEGIRKAKDLSREEILAAARECASDSGAMAERLQVSERGLKLRMRELEIEQH